ncbi:MAG: hypothetical protein ACOX3A_09915 [bacterium]|jgi:hypothetical protein
MSKVDCIYLIPEEYDIGAGSGEGNLYRCLAGDVVLKEADLNQEWACAWCIIPVILNAEHCIYLEPAKRFFNHGESVVVLMCSLKEIMLSGIEEDCHGCPNYIRAAK